jgi:hypothetical protein
VHICFQTIVLYSRNFANGHDTNALWMSSFHTLCEETKCVLRVMVCSTSTSHIWEGIILMLSATVVGPCCYLTGLLLNDIVLFLKLFYRGCLKTCCLLAVRQRFVVSARRSSTALSGKCPAVVERDMPRKMDWPCKADCMTFSVAGSYSSGFFSCEDTSKSMFTQSLPGLS